MQINGLEHLRADVGNNFDFWRARLLSPHDLANLAQSYGLGHFTGDDVKSLWKLGLLRADLVLSATPIENENMPSFGTVDDGDHFAYGDKRQAAHRPEGYGSAFAAVKKGFPRGWSPLFHPYRTHVLLHVDRSLRVTTSSTQYLLYEPGVMSGSQRILDSNSRWTSSPDFAERFHYWNTVSELALVAEPVSYAVIYQNQRPAPWTEPAVDQYEDDLRSMFMAMDKFSIRQIRKELASCAQELDSNVSVHVLLRLMKAHEREKLKGRLGGAMHLLAMAESIRRAAERALQEELPEEDEIGHGTWFPGARKMIYGNARVFDAPKRELRDYLTGLGIDFAIKVRCYVEGATEFGALNHAVGDLGHVQLVNLAGNVAERAGRGLAFADSLAADKNTGVFSVVILDGDREEYLRVLRRAAQEERFHGCFFISEPDMECGNFSVTELIELAFEHSKASKNIHSSETSVKDELLAAAHNISNNNQLSSLLRSHGFEALHKSANWGRTLMQHAIAHPELPSTDARMGKTRPIIEAARLIIRMRNIGFQDSIARERVDPATGLAVFRA